MHVEAVIVKTARFLLVWDLGVPISWNILRQPFYFNL
jgi:hypothetical protein